jgi:hypothetical protein
VKRALVFGVGSSRATSDHMPLTDELGDHAMDTSEAKGGSPRYRDLTDLHPRG